MIRATLGIPSRDNIDTEKPQNDGDGSYYGDEYKWYSMDNTTEAGVAYKHHTVVSKHDNPFWPGDSSEERYLYLSQTSYKVDVQDDTPTDLDANPYAKGEIDSTSFSYLSNPMGSKSASTPRCTDPAHAPGPCPGD